MKKRAPTRPRLFLMAAALLSLAACGIKPDHVDPPQGAEDSTFPAEYPNPQTDPQPGMEQKDRLGG